MGPYLYKVNLCESKRNDLGRNLNLGMPIPLSIPITTSNYRLSFLFLMLGCAISGNSSWDNSIKDPFGPVK